MDRELKSQIEQYILLNHLEYSKETLVNELAKSGLSREDANELYKETLKKLLKPSEKMHYPKSSSLPYFLIGVLIVIFILFLIFEFNIL
jgi:dolichol kinase